MSRLYHSTLRSRSGCLPNPGAARYVVAQSSPLDNVQSLSDVLQGQLKASEGVGVSTIVELLAANAQRVARGFEPLPPNFPPGPTGEQGLQLAWEPLQFLRSTRGTYGRLATVILGGERVVLVGDSEVAKFIVQEEPEAWMKEGTAFFPGSALAGNGLLVSDGKIWQRQRKLTNPAFRSSQDYEVCSEIVSTPLNRMHVQVSQYSKAMTTCTADMLGSVWAPETGKARDIYEDFNQLTLDITLAALFGTELASSNLGRRVSDSIREAFEHFTQRAATGFIVPEWLPTPDNMRYNGAVHRLDTFIYSLIYSRKVELSARSRVATGATQSSTSDGIYDESVLPECLLDALLLSRDDEGRGMEEQNLRDELMTLLVAGQETSAILLGWICASLAWNPATQAAAAAEVQVWSVQEVLQGRVPTMEDIDKLPYCSAVVLETLRQHPPAYMIGRCACKDIRLGNSGYSVTKGTTALVAPYLLHHDPQRWDKPGRFNPERWFRTESSSSAVNWRTELKGFGQNSSYLPFGGGPRVCIGTSFAFVEAVVVVAMVLQRFSLEPVEQGQRFPQPQPLITLRPQSVRVRLQARAPQRTEPVTAKPVPVQTASI